MLPFFALCLSMLVTNVSQFKEAFRDANCCNQQNCSIDIGDECSLSYVTWTLINGSNNYAFVLTNGRIYHNQSRTVDNRCHTTFVQNYDELIEENVSGRRLLDGGVIGRLLDVYGGGIQDQTVLLV